MAKNQRGFKATNAVIDYENMKIVENTKDGVNVFFIDRLFKEWDGVEGISFSIVLNEDAKPDANEY